LCDQLLQVGLSFEYGRCLTGIKVRRTREQRGANENKPTRMPSSLKESASKLTNQKQNRCTHRTWGRNSMGPSSIKLEVLSRLKYKRCTLSWPKQSNVEIEPLLTSKLKRLKVLRPVTLLPIWKSFYEIENEIVDQGEGKIGASKTLARPKKRDAHKMALGSCTLSHAISRANFFALL